MICLRLFRQPYKLSGVRLLATKHKTPASDLNTIYKNERHDNQLKEKFGRYDELNETPKQTMSFTDFKSLNPSIIEQLKNLGYDEPLPIQYHTLTATLKGKSAVIKSATGSGKTLAYVLPLLNKVGPPSPNGGFYPQAIIVAPTRELCGQISNVVESFVGHERIMNMTSGELKVRKQARLVRDECRDIFIATPGRVMQLVSMNIIKPSKLKFLVLDEADELLHDLFYDNMRWILDNSNPSKQMVVTTATVPPKVQFIVDRYMKYHEFIDIGDDAVSFPSQVKHKAVLYEKRTIKPALKWVMSTEHYSRSMVFVKHRDDCAKVAEYLRDCGYNTKYINSDLPDSGRVVVMDQFRAGDFDVLVATDLVSRGVDIPDCSLVIHLKPDLNATKYVHRAGRTGRAGHPGTSVLLLCDGHSPHMDFLEELAEVVDFQFYMYTKSQQYKLEPVKLQDSPK